MSYPPDTQTAHRSYDVQSSLIDLWNFKDVWEVNKKHFMFQALSYLFAGK